MAEGFVSSSFSSSLGPRLSWKVDPPHGPSICLVALNDAVSPRKLDIIKLVAKHAFGIGQQDLDEADLLTSVYTLLEQKHNSSALNILIMILMRLDIDTVLVGALKKHVKQNEIVVEGYQKMDFILTVSCILRSLNKRQYESLKEMARRTFLTNHHPSNIKSRTHLLQLLFDQNCLTPTSFRFLFAWLEVVGCSLYHSELKAYCRRYNIKIPEWDSLVPPLKERFPICDPRSFPRSFRTTESLPASMRALFSHPNFQIIPTPMDIAKWLKEGTVNLTVKRVQMLGPPGSGKTCSRRLLLNEDPPEVDVTDSTPITCRAVKATRISVENGCMTEVDAKALLSRLAGDLKEAAAKQKETSLEESSLEEPSETIPIGNLKTKATESADTAESADDPDANKICRDIVQAIPKAKANLDCNWAYIIDSGGQTAFQELLPLFTRAASLNIITIDLSKGLDEKLDLQYRISGTSFPCDSNFLYTNIEFLNNVLSSGAMLQLYHSPQSEDAAALQCPEYFVLGTHSDDIKVTPQIVAEFNEALSSLASGSEEKGYRIIRPKLNEVIYPVNTMLKSGPQRQEESKKLCTTLFGFNSTNNASDDTFEMPVRWFAFELTLLEKAGNNSILEIDDVLSIGKSFEMTEDDTKKALQHLHNVTIILYYPQVLPDIVFVDPHPILDILSRLLALTYNIERKFLYLLTKPMPLDSELENLRKKGIFALSLLEKLKDDHELSKSNFINLLLHLHIIAKTQDGYFIPSALPLFRSTGSIPKSDIISSAFGSTGPPPGSDIIESLLVVWHNPVTKEILPVPRGIFPLAVVNLIKFKQPQFQFPPDSQEYLRYRDAMSFRVYAYDEFIGTIHFIKKHKHIKIYLETNELKYCPLICEAITEAIYSSSVAINLKHLYKLAFACCSTENCYCIITNEAEEKVECTLCRKSANFCGQEKYWNWFHVTCENSSKEKCQINLPQEETSIITVSDAPRILETIHLKDVRSSLQESKFCDSNWLDLGDQLGLHPTTLKTIEDDHSGVKRRLRETLVKWLEGADGVSPSWASLVSALEAIEEYTVAEHIKCKWIKRKLT